MKTRPWQLLLVIAGMVIVCLISAPLLFIEAWNLCSDLQTLYEDELAQWVRIFFRIMMFILLILCAVFSLIALKKKGDFITVSAFFNYGGAVIAIMSFFFYEWYFGLGLVIGMLLLIASPTIAMFRNRIFEEKEN